MQLLRSRLRRIARFLVMALCLSWGLAIAAPLIKPPVLALVCSADGTRLQAQDEAGGGIAHRLTPECALCILLTPPSLPSPPPETPWPADGPGTPVCATHAPPGWSPIPPPARGPPFPL